MKQQPLLGYLVTADLSRRQTDAWSPDGQPEAAALLLDERAMEQLTTESARLESDTVGRFPETPWHPAILLVGLIGVLIDILFLIR